MMSPKSLRFQMDKMKQLEQAKKDLTQSLTQLETQHEQLREQHRTVTEQLYNITEIKNKHEQAVSVLREKCTQLTGQLDSSVVSCILNRLP